MIDPTFARRRTAHGSGLGTHWWMVERFFAWRHRSRRPRPRTDRTAVMHNAVLKLAVSHVNRHRRKGHAVRVRAIAGQVNRMPDRPKAD